jgi:hypothetical protein
MLQAEILVQYGMRNKAVERLQRIQELFPREEERNEDLQRLYLAAGVTPSYAGSAPLPALAASASATGAVAAAAAAPAPARSSGGDAQRYARGRDHTQAVSPGHGAGGADDRGERDWRALGSIALRSYDAHAGFGADGGAGILRKGVKEGNRRRSKVMCALQDMLRRLPRRASP